jgi:hypothetical protein
LLNTRIFSNLIFLLKTLKPKKKKKGKRIWASPPRGRMRAYENDDVAPSQRACSTRAKHAPLIVLKLQNADKKDRTSFIVF